MRSETYDLIIFFLAGTFITPVGCSGDCRSETKIESRPAPSPPPTPAPVESVIEVTVTPPEPAFVRRPIESLKDLGGGSWQVGSPDLFKSTGHVSFYRDDDKSLYPYRLVYYEKGGEETNCGLFPTKQVDPVDGTPWWVAYCEGSLFTKNAITAARVDAEGIDELGRQQKVVITLGLERLECYREQAWP